MYGICIAGGGGGADLRLEQSNESSVEPTRISRCGDHLAATEGSNHARRR